MLQINQGGGWTVDGHIELFDVLTGELERRATFQTGHRLVVHKIYRDALHPSRLTLPFTVR